MIGASVRAHPGVIVVNSGDIGAMRTSVANNVSQAIVIIIDCRVIDAFDVHLLSAAVEPMAIAAAPRQRVSLVQVLPGADAADVDAAIAYLLTAVSVTGQTIRIAARAGAAP